MSGCVADSPTVDLTLAGGILSADAKISGNAGNQLVEEADGLFATGAPTGCVQFFAGPAAPDGWLLCDGASYLRASYAGLFAVIGVEFGSADGTHFNVPDLRGRGAFGVGTNTDVDALGKSDGLAVSNRSPRHNTDLAGATVDITDPGHAHTVATSDANGLGSVINGTTASGTIPTSSATTGITADVGGAGGPGGARPTDTPAFLALNGIIKI